MKLILPLALISTLVSCTSIENDRRPSAEIPRQGAPGTNKVLDAYSQAAGLEATVIHDVSDDTVDYGGKVVTRQARNYTKIGFNSARRADDLVHREANRYTDYALDTVDDAADLEVRTARRWFRFGSTSAKRALGSTRKVYQGTLDAYGKAVDRTYFAAWNVIIPPEPKPWMVGSVNDRIRPAKVPGGVWASDFVQTTQVEVVPVSDGKGYEGRITK